MTFSKNNSPKRLLVIDDNEAIHEDFRKILKKPKALSDSLINTEAQLFDTKIQASPLAIFEIDSAFQGQEGLDLAQKAKAEDRPYALAFVDGRMPPGWDGIETIRHLWKECPDLQIVLCTAYADYSWQEICRVLGETDNLLILKKPFDNVEVLQMAHSLTRKWELAQEVQYRIENLDDMVQKKTVEKEKLQAEKFQAFARAAETEKLALVGQIAGKMAHDFNNILGAIMGNSELAMLDCVDTPTRKKLELIFNQTIRGKNLTKNLVAFARDQEPKQEFFSVDEKMDLVINLLKKDLEGIHVIREYTPGIPELLADPGMIEHAVVNLLQNSIHALSLAIDPEIIIRTGHQDNNIVIEIEDNGCGIPEKFLGEIFVPSFTLKGSKNISGMYKSDIKGTGYGMANVKKYVDQHKGNITIKSKLQEGTKVTITLPITIKTLTREEIIEVKENHFYSEKYILLVEDESAIADVHYQILNHAPCHHRVDIAENGPIALDLLGKNTYDLISLDYMLPGEINGMDIYHYIRNTNDTIPILFISGNIEFLESIKELRQKDPYIDHLSKPCKNIDYVDCINKLFKKAALLK